MNKKDEERVREIVREEIAKAFAPGGVAFMGISSVVATSTALATRKDVADSRPGAKAFDKHNSSLPIDNMTDQLEIEAMGEVALGYEKRVEVGMTRDQALVMSQIESGYDLTPDGYDLDRGGSYFASFRLSGEAFTKTFVQKIKAGKTREDAYEETCGEFGCNVLKKAGKYRKISEEIASGEFSGARLDAAQDALRKSSDKLLSGGLGSLGGKVDIDET